MYRRVLLKLSGEALEGKEGESIDWSKLLQYAEDIKEAVKNNYEIGIVIGGGNIFRGLSGTSIGIDRVQGDYMGMLATIINSMAIQSALNKVGIKSYLFSALKVEPFTELPSRNKMIEHLEKKEVIIIAGGTGNPYFTTDTAASLRAIEIKADAILKGTRVDGIYNDDPEKNPNAVKFNQLTFDEAIEKNLKIMDQTAFTLCKENQMKIIVFNMNIKGNLIKVLNGENVGTLVK